MGAKGIGNLYVGLGLNSSPFIGSMGDVIKKLDEFKARNAAADKSLKGTGTAMKDTGSNAQYLVAQLKGVDATVGKVAGSFEHMKGMIEATAIGLLAMKGIEKAFDFLKDAVKDAAAEEIAMRKVADVIAATGGAAGKSSQDVDKLALSLMKSSTYTKDSIMDMEAKLLTFRKISGDTFDRASKAALDMAYVMGQEPGKAAIQLGKALQDPINGITSLRRVGVTFSDSQKEVIKSLVDTGNQTGAMKVILQELEHEFGGAAAGAADTYGGKLTVLGHMYGELKEQIGGVITSSGAMHTLIDTITKSIGDQTEKVGENKSAYQQMVKDGVLYGIDAFGIVVAAGAAVVEVLLGIGGVLEIVGGGFQAIGGYALIGMGVIEKAVLAALTPLGWLAQGIDLIGTGFARLTNTDWTLDLSGKMGSLTKNINQAADSMDRLGGSTVDAGHKTIAEGFKMMQSAAGVHAAYEKFSDFGNKVKVAVANAPLAVDNTESKTPAQSPLNDGGQGSGVTDQATADKYQKLIEELDQYAGKIDPYSEAIAKYNKQIDKLNEAWDLGKMSVQTYNDYIDKLNAVFDKTSKKLLDELDAQLNRPIDKYGKAKEDYASVVDKINSYVSSGLIDPSQKGSYMSSAQGMYDAEVAKIDVKQSEEQQRRIEQGIAGMGKAMNEAGIKIKGFDQFSAGYKTLSELGNKIKTGSISADSSTAQLMQIQGYAQLASGIGQAIGGKVGSVISSTASMASSGAAIGTAIGGPITGAVVGGVVGLVSSIFGGGDNGKAQREDARRQAYSSIVQSALSGGTYSAMILKNGGYTYSGVANEHVAGDSRDRLLSDRAEAGLSDLQNQISVLDQAGKTISEMMTTTELQNLTNAKTLLDYTIATVGNLSDVTTAYWDSVIKEVTGITADSVNSMVSNAIDISTSGDQAGRTFTENFEAQVIKGIKDMAISEAIEQAIMPTLTPMLTTLVQGMIGGTLTTDQMAAMVSQVKDLAASVAPIVSTLYDSFNSAGLNTSFTAATDASAPVTLEARASGGPVFAGRSYIVGENRAELFTPGVNGNITPFVPEGGMDYTGFLQELKSILSASQNTTVTIDGQQFSAYIEKKRLQAESKISAGLSRTAKQVF